MGLRLRSRSLLPVMLLPLVLACASTPPASELEARAADIRASLPQLAERRGELRRGDAEIRWTAWIDAGYVVHLLEQRRVGEYGEGENRHTFDQGRLLLYEGRETRAAPGDDGRWEVARVRLLLAPDGTPLERMQMLNERPALLRDFEVEQIVAHAEVLRRAARFSPDSRIDPYGKIRFDLGQLGPDGLRGTEGGRRALHYEFCIPRDPAAHAQVRHIDRTVSFQRDSPGRIGCGADEILCIGHTHQPDHRSVLSQLAALPYVERIEEAVFE